MLTNAQVDVCLAMKILVYLFSESCKGAISSLAIELLH